MELGVILLMILAAYAIVCVPGLVAIQRDHPYAIIVMILGSGQLAAVVL